MSRQAQNGTGWHRVAKGLGFVRRGSVLAAACGLLLLILGTAGRAGCANPHLPEVRSLMHYQSMVFYAGLLLGFILVVGGQLYAALMPLPWKQRAVALGSGGLSTVALLVTTLQAHPGRLAPLNAPPGGVGPLAAAVLGTTAIAASVLLVLQVSRALGGRGMARSAALFGIAMMVAAAANAEAASGVLFPHPVHALYAIAVIAVINAVALAWMVSLLSRAEALIGEHASDEAESPPDPKPEPAPTSKPAPRTS